MERPLLYRKRILPDECIPLNDDEIIYINERIVVTSWKTLHPRHEFDHGQSCYFLQEGYKVSRFLRSDNTLVYWYCDIIDYQYDEEKNSYTFRDLLADVIVMPDGFVKVVDLDEFEQALESESLTGMDVRKALRSLSKLLNIIYDGHFESLTREITMRI